MLFDHMNSIAIRMATSTKEVVPEKVRADEGEALRKLIEKSPFNQATLAKESGVGSKAFVAQLTKGVRPLNLKAACQLAMKLGVKLDDFTPRLAAVVRQAYPLIRHDEATAAAYAVMEKQPPPFVPTSSWPFLTVPPAMYERISPEARRELEAIARGMAIEAQAASG